MDNEKTSEEKKPDVVKTPVVKDLYSPPLWLKIIGPVVGVFAAGINLFVRIRGAFYDKEKNLPGVGDIFQLRNKAHNFLLQMHNNSVPASGVNVSDITVDLKRTLQQFNGTVSKIHAPEGTLLSEQINAIKQLTREAIGKMHASPGDVKILDASTKIVRHRYDEGVKILLEARNICSRGVKSIFQGTWDRWESIGGNTRPGIIVGALISAGAVIASMFMLNLNTRLRHELRDIHEKLGDNVAAAGAGDSPERASAKNTAWENLPRSKVDVQDAQHDRLVAPQLDKARA